MNTWLSHFNWQNDLAHEAAGNLTPGPRPGNIPLPPLFDHVDRNLANLKKMGISVVRWFLLGNGSNYGLASTPRSSGPAEFTPPNPIDKRFKRDFTELLIRFKKAEMQIIPCLIGSVLLLPNRS